VAGQHIIKLPGLGPRYSTVDVEVAASDNEGACLRLTVDGQSVDLYTREVDQVIEAMRMVQKYRD
jgi:hypothetical protein